MTDTNARKSNKLRGLLESLLTLCTQPDYYGTVGLTWTVEAGTIQEPVETQANRKHKGDTTDKSKRR